VFEEFLLSYAKPKPIWKNLIIMVANTVAIFVILQVGARTGGGLPVARGAGAKRAAAVLRRLAGAPGRTCNSPSCGAGSPHRGPGHRMYLARGASIATPHPSPPQPPPRPQPGLSPTIPTRNPCRTHTLGHAPSPPAPVAARHHHQMCPGGRALPAAPDHLPPGIDLLRCRRRAGRCDARAAGAGAAGRRQWRAPVRVARRVRSRHSPDPSGWHTVTFHHCSPSIRFGSPRGAWPGHERQGQTGGA
jgi:hypothetical protein